MVRVVLRVFLATVWLWPFFPSDVLAHRLNESYVYFNVTDEALSGRVEATLNDLSQVLELDDNGDGSVSQDEVQANLDAIHTYFSDRLWFDDVGQRHNPVFDGVEFLELEQGTFALLGFTLPALAATPDEIGMHYEFLFDAADPGHRGFALIESNTRTGIEENEAQFSLIFGPGNTNQVLSLVGRPWVEIFAEFVTFGVWHILTGFDHILFLIALLLASVLRVVDGRFQPVDDFGTALWNMAKIVTLFTVANTIALSLAAAGGLTWPVILVEAVIALSIAIVALDNIVPRFHRNVWIIVCAFGVFHGFGFANVLAPLGVDQNSKLAAIAGFNIGVEIGQLLVVVVVLPILFLMRQARLYVPLVVGGVSSVMIALALFWFTERTFNVFGNVRGTLFGLVGAG